MRQQGSFRQEPGGSNPMVGQCWCVVDGFMMVYNGWCFGGGISWRQESQSQGKGYFKTALAGYCLELLRHDVKASMVAFAWAQKGGHAEPWWLACWLPTSWTVHKDRILRTEQFYCNPLWDRPKTNYSIAITVRNIFDALNFRGLSTIHWPNASISHVSSTFCGSKIFATKMRPALVAWTHKSVGCATIQSFLTTNDQSWSALDLRSVTLNNGG